MSIRFKNAGTGEWDTLYYDCIFDTGAEVSFVPDFIMKKCNYSSIYEGEMRGIVDTDECSVKVKLAWATIKLKDINGNESKEIRARVAFHQTPTLFLIGMKNIIEMLGMHKQFSSDDLILTTE